MRPEVVVLPAPAIGQALGLRHRGKKLGVEEFIPEPISGVHVKGTLHSIAIRGRCTRSILFRSTGQNLNRWKVPHRNS